MQEFEHNFKRKYDLNDWNMYKFIPVKFSETVDLHSSGRHKQETKEMLKFEEKNVCWHLLTNWTQSAAETQIQDWDQTETCQKSL